MSFLTRFQYFTFHCLLHKNKSTSYEISWDTYLVFFFVISYTITDSDYLITPLHLKFMLWMNESNCESEKKIIFDYSIESEISKFTVFSIWQYIIWNNCNLFKILSYVYIHNQLVLFDTLFNFYGFELTGDEKIKLQ